MNRKIYIFAASLMAFSSCSFLDVPPTVMVGGYTSEEEALYGLAGVYGVINNEAIAQRINLPKNEKVAAIIVYGYEDGEHHDAPKRKDIDEVLRFID